MNSLTTTLSIATALLVAFQGFALADEDETRIAATAGSAYTQFDAFEGEGTAILSGGGIAYAIGIRNWLELGTSTSYHFKSGTQIDSATLNEVGNGMHKVFASLHVADASLFVRTYLEIGPFLEFRPLVGVRAGAQLIGLTGPQLFLQGLQIGAEGEDDWNLSPYSTVETGATYRISDNLEAGLIVTGSVSRSQSRFGLHLEISWMSY